MGYSTKSLYFDLRLEQDVATIILRSVVTETNCLPCAELE
jgi:hypothetical protein